MLPLTLPEDQVDKVFADAEAGNQVEVDLPKQVVRTSDGQEYSFEIDGFRKHCLVNGLDDINLTLQHEKKIDVFEGHRSKDTPWLDGVSANMTAAQLFERDADLRLSLADWLQRKDARCPYHEEDGLVDLDSSTALNAVITTFRPVLRVDMFIVVLSALRGRVGSPGDEWTIKGIPLESS